jgi:hypothetical protein
MPLGPLAIPLQGVALRISRMHGFRVIPSITTISRCASGWRDKIGEIEALGLTSVGLFLTGVREAERRELYRELELAHVRHLFTVPFVHAVSDMPEDEYRYLIDRFGVELFNLHPVKQFPLQHKLSAEIRRKITIENTSTDQSIDLLDLSGFNGICLDMAHAEDLRCRSGHEFEKLARLTTMAPVLVNPISVSGEVAHSDSHGNLTYHSHVTVDGRDVSYLERYPLNFFGSIVAVELADLLAVQVKLVPVIQEMLVVKGTILKRAA